MNQYRRPLNQTKLMPAKIYTEKDASLAPLKGKTCAVIGFGSQGHAHALNLKESGVKVVIGLYPGSKSRAVAEEKGLKVYTPDVAAFRKHVQEAYLKSDLSKSWEKGALDKINAL